MDDAPSPSTPPARRPLGALLLLLPAAAFVALLAYGLGASAGPPAPGDAAPGFEAPLLEDDGTLALADLRGRPVVLNFWASWCGPCEDEAPMFKSAADRYAGRVAFVGVDIRDARSDAIAFVREHGLDYPHVRDERLEIYRDYGLTGQPETFFIAADGTIVEHVAGALPSERRLLELVELALRHG